MPQDAATHVWCALSPQLDGRGGMSRADADIAPVLPQGDAADPLAEDRVIRAAGVRAYAIDPDAAELLRHRSEIIAEIGMPNRH